MFNLGEFITELYIIRKTRASFNLRAFIVLRGIMRSLSCFRNLEGYLIPWRVFYIKEGARHFCSAYSVSEEKQIEALL